MLSSSDDFSDRVSLSYSHHVSAASLINNLADFAVEPSVRQSLLLGRIYLDYDTCAKRVVVEELCEFRFSLISDSFPHKTAGSRAISF
jgi:hypothetical protein